MSTQTTIQQPATILSNLDTNKLIRIKRIEFIKLIEDLPPSNQKIQIVRKILNDFIENTHDDDILHKLTECINFQTLEELTINFRNSKLAILEAKT
ncbi:MAG: hypothetical protein U9Q20_08195 [Campylobacterota bacterium]|nr:hypothetical protein [Campylobacterota bacterium]